jgi:hypothetical protein
MRSGVGDADRASMRLRQQHESMPLVADHHPHHISQRFLRSGDLVLEQLRLSSCDDWFVSAVDTTAIETLSTAKSAGCG